MANRILKEKNKVRGLMLPNFKSYLYEALGWYKALWSYRVILAEQTNRSMEQERVPRHRPTESQLLSDKSAKATQGRKDSFSTNAGITRSSRGKKNQSKNVNIILNSQIIQKEAKAGFGPWAIVMRTTWEPVSDLDTTKKRPKWNGKMTSLVISNSPEPQASQVGAWIYL